MENIKILLTTLGILFLLCLPAGAKTITGKIVGVSDGDTIKVVSAGKQIKIRLYGIDTPEKKQAFGKAATRKLKAILSPSVTVDTKDVDRYGRSVGIVYTATGDNINRELVESGYAWVYKRYCKESFCNDWLDLEASARNQEIGLWEEKAIPPWEWRRGNKNKSTKRKLSQNGTGRNYRCGGKTKCGQMTSCKEAHFYLESCGLSRLDRDKDGIPCESICH